MIKDTEQLKKMLIRRLNTTKLYANDGLMDGIDLAAIKEYVLDKSCKEIKVEDLTVWHHLMYCYEILDDSSFEEIISALTLENIFRVDPNSTAYKILDTIMKGIGSDSSTLLQKLIKEDESTGEIDIKSLSEAI
jgi:hypothetical protein